MPEQDSVSADKRSHILRKYIPGAFLFSGYRREWLTKDIAAGLSVASIALPLGIAYSSLAGLPPETGLYSTILPMAAYALFGTSRQLIIGPDSATCLMVGASLAMYASDGTPEYRALSSVFCLLVGVFAIVAGFFKLGFVANFMSRPILTGYLNGLALSIIVGQFGKLCGFPLKSEGLFRMLYSFVSSINEVHLLTLAIGAGTFVFLRLMKTFAPKIPAPLIVIAVCAVASAVYGLSSQGVAVVGALPSGLPALALTGVDFKHFPGLIPNSMEILLITYCSMMLTSKSFANKRGYRIEPNQEFIALGVSNIFSGLSQGFVVSGADSRTAVNDSFGGKTQLVAVIASITIAIFVMFFTGYLELVPVTILAAIVISASIGLFDIGYLKSIYRISRAEFGIAVLTGLCVLSLGVIPALVIAVLLSIVRLIMLSTNPTAEILGRVEQTGSYHNVETNPDAVSFPGLMIFRFPASLLFYNASGFSESLRSKVKEFGPGLKCVMIDCEVFAFIDVTGAVTLKEEVSELRKEGVDVIISSGRSRIRKILKNSGVAELAGEENMCYTLDEGTGKYLNKK